MRDQSSNDLVYLAKSVSVHSDTEINIQGRRIQASLGPSTNNYLLQALQVQLYGLYTRYYVPHHALSPHSAEARIFIHQLSQANQGDGTWDPGWQVVSLEKYNKLHVIKDGIPLWVDMEYARCSNHPIKIGDKVYVRIGKEMRSLLPGFYLAVGNEPQNEQPEELLTRLYWNLAAEGAAVAISSITKALNKLRIPFRLKVLNDPSSYSRSDAGVLYLDKENCIKIGETLRSIHNSLKPWLKDNVPRLVKKLGKGWGVAECTSSGASFGEQRCQFITQGLWQAWQSGNNEPEQRVGFVRNTFIKTELDPDKPYLEPQSKDMYEF